MEFTLKIVAGLICATWAVSGAAASEDFVHDLNNAQGALAMIDQWDAVAAMLENPQEYSARKPTPEDCHARVDSHKTEVLHFSDCYHHKHLDPERSVRNVTISVRSDSRVEVSWLFCSAFKSSIQLLDHISIERWERGHPRLSLATRHIVIRDLHSETLELRNISDDAQLWCTMPTHPRAYYLSNLPDAPPGVIIWNAEIRKRFGEARYEVDPTDRSRSLPQPTEMETELCENMDLVRARMDEEELEQARAYDKETARIEKERAQQRADLLPRKMNEWTKHRRPTEDAAADLFDN